MHKITFTLSGDLYWPSYEAFLADGRDEVGLIISAYIKGFFVELEKIRELARSGVWRIYFNSCKNSRDLFDKPLSDLDINQLNLLYWSTVYDNALNIPRHGMIRVNA